MLEMKDAHIYVSSESKPVLMTSKLKLAESVVLKPLMQSLNICDGCPGAGSYGGYSAVLHTKKQVRKLNMDLGIKSIGYFFGSEAGYGWSRFQEMYGAATSKAIPDANNATQIADFMNKKLMSK